ncbi:MAG: hypothetical protein AAF614_25160, partial [Chloroflexota bacterium]
QVAVTRHLLKQAPEAILIPEEIRIKIGLIDPAMKVGWSRDMPHQEELQNGCILLEPIFKLNRETAHSWRNIFADQLSAMHVRMPSFIDERYVLIHFTEICVYKNQIIKVEESGLTSPRLCSITGRIEPNQVIQFYYELGAFPQLRGIIRE